MPKNGPHRVVAVTTKILLLVPWPVRASLANMGRILTVFSDKFATAMCEYAT